MSMIDRIKTRPDGSSYISNTRKIKNPIEKIKEARIEGWLVGRKKPKLKTILQVIFPEKDKNNKNLELKFAFSGYESAEKYFKKEFQKEPEPEWEWV